MIYRGDPNLVHVSDGQRNAAGQKLAKRLDTDMRMFAAERTADERASQSLCPGCYMVVGFDMMLALADANSQSRTELARSMIGAFQRLINDPTMQGVEDIHVYLDPE